VRRLLLAICAAGLIASPAKAITITEHPALPTRSAPQNLLAGPDGRLYFDTGPAQYDPEATGPPGVGVYDPRTGRGSVIELAYRPLSLALAGGSLWALGLENVPIGAGSQLQRIDLASGEAASVPFVGKLGGLAASPGGDHLYALRRMGDEARIPLELVEIDLVTGAERGIHTFGALSSFGKLAVASDGAVWVAYNVLEERQANGIASALRLARIDPVSGASAEYPADTPPFLDVPSAGAAGDVWVSLSTGTGLPNDNGGWRVGHADPAAGLAIRALPVAVDHSQVGGFAIGPDGAVWYGTILRDWPRADGGGAIVRLDPKTGRQQVFPPPSASAGLTRVTRSADGRSLWFTGEGEGGTNLTEATFEKGGLDSGNAETVIANGLLVGVACPADCTGSAALQTRGARVASTLAARRFSLRGLAAQRTLRLKVTRAGRTKLRRTVHAVVRVTVKLKGRPARTHTRRIVLRR
jgi:hypothetical protein